MLCQNLLDCSLFSSSNTIGGTTFSGINFVAHRPIGCEALLTRTRQHVERDGAHSERRVFRSGCRRIARLAAKTASVPQIRKIVPGTRGLSVEVVIGCPCQSIEPLAGGLGKRAIRRAKSAIIPVMVTAANSQPVSGGGPVNVALLHAEQIGAFQLKCVSFVSFDMTTKKFSSVFARQQAQQFGNDIVRVCFNTTRSTPFTTPSGTKYIRVLTPSLFLCFCRRVRFQPEH